MQCRLQAQGALIPITSAGSSSEIPGVQCAAAACGRARLRTRIRIVPKIGR